MFRNVLFLCIFGAFFIETSGFLCVYLSLISEVTHVLIHGERPELCNKPEDLEAYVHNVAQECSEEMNEDDVSLWVQHICENNNVKEVSLYESTCSLERLKTSPCKIKVDRNLPFRSLCLRALWGYYDCILKDVKTHCGKSASNITNYIIKACHLLARNSCMKQRKK